MKAFLKDGRCEVDSRYMDIILEFNKKDIEELRGFLKAVDESDKIPFDEKDENHYITFGDWDINEVSGIIAISGNISHE